MRATKMLMVAVAPVLLVAGLVTTAFQERVRRGLPEPLFLA